MRFAFLISAAIAASAFTASAKPKTKPVKPFPRSHRLEKFLPIETADVPPKAGRAPAAASKPTRDQIDPNVFFDRVDHTMLDCPARIWPSYDWSKFQVILLRPQRKTSVLWKGRDRSRTEIDNSRVPQRAFDGLYDFFELDQVSTMSIQVDPAPGQRAMDALTLFRVAVHEFFHIEGQKGWVMPENQKRGTAYPMEAKARFQRFMLFDRMFRYFLDPQHDEKLLGNASYWFQQWTTDFPDEARDNTDLSEGTARYLDLISAAIAERGCASSEADIYAYLQKITRQQLGGSVTSGHYGVSDEGYDLGSLASLILRVVKHDPFWQEQAAKGASPLASLLKDIAPIAEPGELAVKAKIENDIANQNRQIAGVVGARLDDIGRKDVTRVSIAPDWMPANFSPLFELLPKAYPGWTAIPMAEEMRLQSGGGTDLKTRRGAIYLENGKRSPCDIQGFALILLIPSAQLKKEKTGFRSADAYASGSLQGEIRKDGDGFTWLCGK